MASSWRGWDVVKKKKKSHIPFGRTKQHVGEEKRSRPAAEFDLFWPRKNT